MLGLKNLKVRGALGILAASALLLGGCAAGTPAETTSTATGGSTDTSTEVEKLVIGFSEPLAGQAWRETGLAALMAIANRPEYRDKIELKIVRTNDNDVAQQNAAMLNLIAEGVDGILFDPASSSGVDAALAEAKARGIPVIAAGGLYDNEDVYVVSPDYNSAGAIGIEWLLANLGDNKEIAFLEGLPGVPLNDGAVPFLISTLETGGAVIAAQGTNGWNEATAQENMAAILRSNPDVGGVFSFLTGGQGVPEAFAAAGLDFVPVVGGSGYNGEACTLVKYRDQGLKGMMAFAQPAIYAKAFTEMVRLLEGETLEKQQFFPIEQVTDENAEQFCLPNRADNFQLGYDFPGLNITAEEIETYYQQ